MNDKMSFLLTSCGRLNLLDRTLESFFKFNNYPLEELYLTEDSVDQDVYKKINQVSDQPVELLFGETAFADSLQLAMLIKHLLTLQAG